MRAHSVINEVNKEPWEYGDSVTNVNRKTIELRYRFLPFIYTQMEIASRTGVPPMRPMIFNYPGAEEFQGVASQYMFGDDLLVAPVLDENERTKDVLLPSGQWYDYWSDSLLVGPRSVRVDAPLDRLPLFVRAGAALPTRQVVQSTAQAPINPLTITVYPDRLMKDDRTECYEDDGHSFAYEKGGFLKRMLVQHSDNSEVRLAIAKAEGTYVPAARRLVVAFKGMARRPARILVNGKTVPLASPPRQAIPGWSYDSRTATLWMDDTNDAISIVVVSGN